MTADEIRERIIDVVSRNGGHLASSLGAVEIAMALAETFDPARDRVVWDVGHQAYAWKLLTDRRGLGFDSLRQLDGMAPFPNPSESVADAAVAGHAGVALSVAAGLAAARDLRGTDESVIAVIGDASIANGTSFEALNTVATATRKVIVVLNDNEMSISRPAGSLAKLFGRLITSIRYNRVKAAAESAGHRLRLTFLRGIYHRIESRIKSWFLSNAVFEHFGLRYIGPVDGHDLVKLKEAFTVAKEDKRSVLVHVVTRKGKGYAPAEREPTKFHGIGPFARAFAAPADGDASLKTRGWSEAMGAALVAAARRDTRIVALTAGMKDGTGLVDFAREFPDRFHDVGIAEGHMVAFAAGLAAGGRRPVIAVYSTFLQRAIDQVLHDVCISNLPVIFCVDRAGAVGADGVTHQGLYDIAMLRVIPNLTICQPCDAADLEALLAEALERKGPTVIRYPRGAVPRGVVGENRSPKAIDGGRRLSRTLIEGEGRLSIWATGDQLAKACAVAERLPGSSVVFARYLKPFDTERIACDRAAGRRIVSIENGTVAGGFGEAIGADLRFGWPDAFIPHGLVPELESRYHFDVDSIVAECKGDSHG